MLTLHHGPNTVVTDESFSVKLKWVNPCCFHDTIPGDVGLGIEISVNEYTRAEYGNPHRFEKFSTANDRKFPNHAIRKNGVSLIAGTLVITNATAQTYSGWLQSEVGVLGAKQRDKFINEMPLKTGVTFNPVANDEYACVTVYNPNFWDGIGREIDDPRTHLDENGVSVPNEGKIGYLTERLFTLHQGYINRYDNALELITTGEGCVVSPFLKLYYVLKEILRINGFFIQDSANILTNAFAQVLLYNNFNVFKQAFTTEIQELGYWDYNLNDWVVTDVNEVLDTTWSLDTFNYADLVPRISLKILF